ncbi:MAG: hypothetical protein M3R63_04635, partial [Actinomycetota bacterium]|nr:hypothetical protein [Actinomycetota bacterium]
CVLMELRGHGRRLSVWWWRVTIQPRAARTQLVRHGCESGRPGVAGSAESKHTTLIILAFGPSDQATVLDGRTKPVIKTVNQKTIDLLQALKAVGEQIPSIAVEIADEKVSPADQAEFGDLLIRLGELVKLHAWEVRGHL